MSTTRRRTSAAEALRLQAEPVGCLVDEGGRLFLLPLLLRRVCSGEAPTKDAVSPYGYPGIVLNEDGAATRDFPDGCLDGLPRRCSAMRTCCAAFVRLHPLLNAPLGKQFTRHSAYRERPHGVHRSRAADRTCLGGHEQGAHKRHQPGQPGGLPRRDVPGQPADRRVRGGIRRHLAASCARPRPTISATSTSRGSPR